MNDFQKELFELRKRIADALRAELMGPGSEVSYPDKEHELISEYPSDRYSVGILYPQNVKFGDNDSVNEESNEIEDEELIEEGSDNEEKREQFKMFKDDAFDDDVNMAQQNKPSSMGFTFFSANDINKLKINVQYARYVVADDNNIVVPYPYDDLYVPECLNNYIAFDKEKKVIKKLQSIKRVDLENIFERYSIEDPDLLKIITNLNGIFRSKRSYRRCPYSEDIMLDFSDNRADVNLKNTKGYVTAVKHIVTGSIYSITIMLVNADKDSKGHIFQPRISVNCVDNNGLRFVNYKNITDISSLDEEEKSLDLLYSKKLVYGAGHGVSVDWRIDDNEQGEIFTEFMPLYEVPKINLNLRRETEQERAVNARSLSMKYLSDLDKTERATKITDMQRFIECYGAWIYDQQDEMNGKDFPTQYRQVAEKHIAQCRESYNRMKKGLEILGADEVAWQAFQLTNRAMFMQRIHGAFQKEEHYPDDEKWQREMAKIDYYSHGDDNCRWRPFQLAFLLMSINSITNPSCAERDLVDLIWFPTGGGKTEAYLGLTAFTIFHRRLKNPKNSGTTVLMRYTLRLLTSQQFTRAATLICACEKIRKDEEKNCFRQYNLGNEKITIGLWIGGDHIPNTNAKAREIHEKLTKSKWKNDKDNKFQVLKCPWCGTKMVQEYKQGKTLGKWGYKFRNNAHFYLSCTQENCEFERELPIQIIDEELYKNPPTLLFGTVDKFAMMAWKKDIKSFFGNSDNDAPDLIIQDELHLISGPLGSMVGIYETAIDYLCSCKGRKPKIIASTATIRQAVQQCRALYNREVRQFPAQGLSASDSFFAKEVPTKLDFGRLYLGVMPSGKTKVMLQARATAIALQYVHQLQCPDNQKDQFYTLANYFNSLKELGKASSVVSDDVKDFIKRISYRQIVKLYSSRNIGMPYELTSRVSTSELNDTLERLENMVYSQKNIAEKKYPINVLLASNMISVGVDVSRLNLMFLQGQPKSVSEYIQASSRIGRTNPGLAVTLYDATKSRDRSYYEQFKAFHGAFYKFVEPTGVTPFSLPARDRALYAILLSGVRQSVEELNPDAGAMNIDGNIDNVIKFAEFIYERAKEINSYNPLGMKDDSEQVKSELEDFIEEWKRKARNFDNLIYGDKYILKDAPKDTHRLIKRYDDKCGDDAQRTLTSLRNVDKTVPVSVLIWEDEYEER
ncbi:MAG: helicase [Clostridia bacterium]|nr:helicase [Clostridia bacterium]